MCRNESSLVLIGDRVPCGSNLVCVPHAGAGVAAFASWDAEFADVASLWAARFPGRESRMFENPLATIESMAGSLLESVLDLKADNLVLYGDCSGALVVYELAHRITALKPNFLTLVVNSQFPPATRRSPENKIVSEAALPEIMEYLRGMPYMDAEILENIEFMELLLPAIRSDIAAVEQYVDSDQRAKLNSPIIAIGDKGNDSAAKEMSGWRKLTSATFELVLLDSTDLLAGRGGAVKKIVTEAFRDHVKPR